MKVLNVIAIIWLAASILVGYFSNELTAGDLIFRVVLIAGNIVGYATCDEE